MNDRQSDAGDPAASAQAVDSEAAEPTPLSPLFHFALPAEWQAAQASGTYKPAAFEREGFIHCATEVQVEGVIERHLRGHGPRVRLQLDPSRLRDTLRWEWSAASNDLYPHVFAAIPLDAVLQATPFDPH